MRGVASALLGGAALAAMLGMKPAMAQGEAWRPVEFRAASAQEMQIVQGVYAQLLRSATGAEIAVARVDIDGDRVAELAVRISHPTLCGPSGCHTVILQAVTERGRQTWTPILERRSTSLETGRMSQGRPSALRIRVNGREIWEIGPNGLYAALIESFGAPVELRATMPQPVLRAALAAANREAGGGNDIRPDAVFAAPVELGGARLWLAQISSGLLCGQVGCPVYILSGDAQPRVLAQFGALEGGLAVGRWPGGEGLIAAQSPTGVTLFAFQGGRLVVRETTFPSQATPTP